MKTKFEFKINKTLLFTVAILYLAITISMYLLTGIYAKYTDNKTSGSNSRVAAYVFNVNEGSASFDNLANNIKKPGDKFEFEFVVTNEDATSVSEVAQEYSISLTQNGTLPLTTTLYKIDSSNNKAPLFTLNGFNDLNNIKAELNPGTTEAITYVIVIEWTVDANEQNKNSMYGEIGNFCQIKLEISSEQID